MSLNNTQKRFLRGLTHSLKPVVMVADKGLTDNIMAAIEEALDQHELIKIRLRVEREQRAEMIKTIAEQAHAIRIHSIGQVVSFYRRHPKKPVIALPG